MQFRYVCTQCGQAYPIVPQVMVCQACAQNQPDGQPLVGVLEVELKGTVGPDFDVHELLPVERRHFPPIPVGNTPLWSPENLRRQTGFKNLYIKDDGANPTFSFKDRASYLVAAFARQYAIRDIVLASTGNAGSSMAGVGAAAGLRVTLFLPESAPAAKLIQALQYGATVHRVKGNYDLAYDLSMAFSAARGGMSRNTAHNPMTIEGKKTVSLELFRQLPRVPDAVFVAAGDGCILAGVYKGFRDLQTLGLSDRIPRVYAVQAETSDALYRAFQTGRFENLPTHTVADSICVDVPRNGFHALAQLKRHGGEVITVSDAMILDAQARLSRTTGLFAEPAGAAALAGFLKLCDELNKDDLVVVLTTGNGLKDTVAASRGIVVPDATISDIATIV